jgi:ferritin-like metal-binding protein YciE
MAIRTTKELFVSLLSELRDGAERTGMLYEQLGQAAHSPEIKEALDAREFISCQNLVRLDECFRLIGEKPTAVNGHLHDVFLDDFRRGITEIQSPVARRIFILAKANRLMHLRVGEYAALIAASDATGHPSVGVILESCMVDKIAFMERTRSLICEHVQRELAITRTSALGSF